MAVDIGAEAIDRSDRNGAGSTYVNKTGRATVAGTITSIDIWAQQDITGLRVGTFYTTNGNTLKCRDSEAIAGTITAGGKVTKVVSITVEIDDYIGCYFATGRIERDSAGFDGVWDVGSEQIDPNDEVVYGLNINWAQSLGGYIEEPSVTGDGDLIGIGVII